MNDHILLKLLMTAALLVGSTACTQEDNLSGNENEAAESVSDVATTTAPEAETADSSTTTPDAEEAPDASDQGSWTISVGAFTLDGDTYVDTGVALTFESEGTCQTWSRTARGDAHDSESHPHYNAATNVAYDNDAKTFSWTEYGPELDQSSIEATCAQGTGGVTKTVDEDSFYQDKPNLYLKLIGAVQH